MAGKVIHLDLGPSVFRPEINVSECGHFAPSGNVTSDWKLVTCRLCKRTNKFRHMMSRDIPGIQGDGRCYVLVSWCDSHGTVLYSAPLRVLEHDQILTIAPGTISVSVS
jgi:hypothetical protein